MRRRSYLVAMTVIIVGTVASGTVTAAATGSAARPAAVAGSWGRAIEVPGLGALNTGGDARVFSVSCASPGNCSAGGDYRNRHRHLQGFVVTKTNGRWGQAIEVPGLRALNKGGAEVTSVSCASAGNCAAGGSYEDDRSGNRQGFVVSEANGRWRQAIEVPGLGALNTGGGADVSAVSCASAGNCAAGGDYFRSHFFRGFVAVERDGVWGRAMEVPGLVALNRGDAEVTSVSCASAGSCSAGGDYTDGGGNTLGFVASERHGRWGRAIEVPGLAALNKGDLGFPLGVTSVSCAAAGNCAAVGDYTDGDLNQQGFVVSERHGRWGRAIEVPGLGALNKSGEAEAEVYSVSCAAAGNCAAVGDYTDGDGRQQGFVASERHGRWGRAIEVPGLGALNKGDAAVESVSCTPDGGCAASGYYSAVGGDTDFQGFVVVERDDVWGRAIEVPGLGALNRGGGAAAFSVSCAAAGGCAVGGYYTGRRHHSQGFVASQTG
jgi:hypothetical protein